MVALALRPTLVAATAAGTFTHLHIAGTALATGVLVAGIGVWRLGRRRVLDAGVVAVIVTLAVYLWRASANMPQLNDDGLSGYSANDWLAPIVVFIALTLYADLRPPSDLHRYRQVRALATIVAFGVNVLTI